MALRYMMQARSSLDGELYGWSSSTQDWDAVGFTGPGSAEDVTVVAVHGQPDASDLVTTNKPPVFVVIRTNVSLSACSISQDGATLSANKRVLLVGQTDKSENGIQVCGAVNAGTVPFTRSSDADEAADFAQGISVYVQAGAYGAGATYVMKTIPPVVVDTTELTFARVSDPRKVQSGETCVADGSTNDYTAYNDALGSQTDLPFEVSPGSHLITPPTSLVITRPHKFAKGGILKPSAAKVILFQEDAKIDASPHHQIFDTSAGSGAEVRIRHRGPIYANWWLGAGMDIAEAWNEMMRSCRHTGTDSADKFPVEFRIAPGAYDVTTPFDVTCLSANQTVNWDGAVVYSDVGRKTVAFDMTGTSGVTVKNVKLKLVDCAIGILEARPDSAYDRTYGGSTVQVTAGKSSGKNVFQNVSVDGFAALGVSVNIAAEESIWTPGCYLLNRKFASSTLNGAITASDTTVVATSGASFHDPDDGDGDYYVAVMEIQSGHLEYEIMKVTTRSGNTFTVTRAQLLSTARAFSDDCVIVECGRYCRALMSDVQAQDQDYIPGGFGTVSPFSDPGNESATESSSGYHSTDLYLFGDVYFGLFYIRGSNYVHSPGSYLSSGFAPHVVIDTRVHGCASVCMASLGTDQTGLGGQQVKTSIKIIGSSENIEATQLDFSRTRNIKATLWAVEIPNNACVLDSVFEWPDPCGFFSYESVRLDNVDIRGSSTNPQTMVLPTHTGGTNASNGKFERGLLRCREVSAVTMAGSMAGSRVEGLGYFDRVTSAVTPTEVRQYGDYGVADRIVGGFRVEGFRGNNLRDEAKTLVVLLGTWYLLPYNTLTANRITKLSSTNAAEGEVLTIARQDLNAFTYEIKDEDSNTSLFTFPASTILIAKFRFTAGAWTFVEVRRPEVDARTIVEIAHPTLWTGYYDADAIYLPEGGAVATFYSLLGTGVDLGAEGTVTAKLRGCAGRPSIHFDGGCFLSSAAALANIQSGDDLSFTAITQFRQTSTAGTQTLFGWGKSDAATQRQRIMGVSGTGWESQRRGDSGGSLTSVGNIALSLLDRIVAWVYDGSTKTIKCYDMSSDGYDATDGPDFSEVMDTVALTVDRYALGALDSNGARTNNFVGDMRRHCVGPTAVAEADLQDMYESWWRK